MSALVFTKVYAYPTKLVLTVENDGGGAADTLANADLLAMMVAGPLKDLFNQAVVGLTTAQARAIAFGEGVPPKPDGSANIDGFYYPHARVTTKYRAGDPAELGIGVDADTDATTPTKIELNVQTFENIASIYLVTIELAPSSGA